MLEDDVGVYYKVGVKTFFYAFAYRAIVRGAVSRIVGQVYIPEPDSIQFRRCRYCSGDVCSLRRIVYDPYIKYLVSGKSFHTLQHFFAVRAVYDHRRRYSHVAGYNIG